MNKWDRDDPMQSAVDPTELARELKRAQEKAERLQVKVELAEAIRSLERIKKANEGARSVCPQLLYDALQDLKSALAGHTRTKPSVGQVALGH